MLNCHDTKNTGHKRIQEFNLYYTDHSLQLLKVIFPHLQKQTQKSIAIYIKFMELKYTLENGHKYPYGSNEDNEQLLENLLDVSTGKERETIVSIKNTFDTMTKLKETIEMVQMMQEMCPEGDGAFDFETILKEVMGNGPTNMDG